MMDLQKDQSIQERQKELIISALAYIESNLESDISVKSITEQFEGSHWYFQRLFRSVVGLSAGNYLRLRRLTEAAALIKKSNFRILDIAIQFNFGSQEAFARAFKAFSQVSPTDYKTNPNWVLREAQNPLTREKIDFFWNDVQRTPHIQTVSEKILFGSRVDFLSHFEEGSDCASKVVAHWQKFLVKKKNLKAQVGDQIYGVALSSEKEMREKKLSYVASIETSDYEQNFEDYEYLMLPAGLYARFENVGLAQKRSSLMDYVYGIWLPESGYVRGFGYDFEVFDHRYTLGKEDSISELYIPVRKN